MHKIISKITLVILLMTSLGCNVDADPDWQGTYFYEHEVGEGAGGVVSFIEYNLTLGNDGACKIEMAGLQVDEQILCTATASSGAIAIAFRSYASGDVKNPLGISVYSVGGILFSLHADKSSLITRWQALLPDGIKNMSGEYFVLVK